MSNSRLEWKVGLFVFIGLALLGALLLQFSKGTTFFRPTYTILLRAENVGGLKTRADVLMAGVRVGTVSDLKLGPEGTNVTISLRVYSQYVIHKDARILIEQSGFLGDQYVAVIPTKNQGDVFHDQDVAVAEAPFNLQEVARYAGGFLKSVDETTHRLNETITDVRRLVLNEQTLTNFAVAVNNMRTVSERALLTVDEINSLVASNGPALDRSGSNLVYFSEQINGFAQGLSGVLATNSSSLNSAVKNIESSTVVLKTLMDDLQAGKGLAGKVLKDDELAATMSRMANDLSITTSNLNRLGLWGILWKKKAPKNDSPALPLRPGSSPKDH
jgi:phospholipid/cholesterol/gamma-HCH transport system substrate-binding protein